MIRWFCVDLASARSSTKWLTQLADILDWAPTPDPETTVPPDVIFVRETSMLREYGPGLLFALERYLHRSGYGWYRGLLLRGEHLVLLNTDRVTEQLTAGSGPRDPAGFVEITVAPAGSVWLRPVHLTDSQAAQQLRDRVPPGQRAMIAGHASPRVVRSFIDDGWADQTDGAAKPPGDPLVRCCLTTPGLGAVDGSAWVDTSSTPYSWRRAFGGVLTLGVAATDRG